LSCCAKAKLPKTASNTATITIAGNGVLFMAHSCAAVCKSSSWRSFERCRRGARDVQFRHTSAAANAAIVSAGTATIDTEIGR
jgi:hypothetical protein